MRLMKWSALVLVFASICASAAKDDQHVWSVGKILDAGRARYYAGTINNSSSSTTTNGSVNATANSSTLGGYTNTDVNGSYSGRSSTSSSVYSQPIYKVYDNLVIEGADSVYVTSERLHWRWSKGAHVA